MCPALRLQTTVCALMDELLQPTGNTQRTKEASKIRATPEEQNGSAEKEEGIPESLTRTFQF